MIMTGLAIIIVCALITLAINKAGDGIALPGLFGIFVGVVVLLIGMTLRIFGG